MVVEGSCCGAELAEGDGGDGKENVSGEKVCELVFTVIKSQKKKPQNPNQTGLQDCKNCSSFRGHNWALGPCAPKRAGLLACRSAQKGSVCRKCWHHGYWYGLNHISLDYNSE